MRTRHAACIRIPMRTEHRCPIDRVPSECAQYAPPPCACAEKCRHASTDDASTREPRPDGVPRRRQPAAAVPQPPPQPHRHRGPRGPLRPTLYLLRTGAVTGRCGVVSREAGAHETHVRLSRRVLCDTAPRSVHCGSHLWGAALSRSVADIRVVHTGAGDPLVGASKESQRRGACLQQRTQPCVLRLCLPGGNAQHAIYVESACVARRLGGAFGR